MTKPSDIESPGRDDPGSAVVTALLRAVLEDRVAGVARGADEYRALFPGFEDVVARELAALEEPAGDGTAGDGRAGPPAPGGRLGAYELLEVIGEGGFGTVWRARDERVGRIVALKVSSRAGLGGRVLHRFRREARIASRLEHPGICVVYDSELERFPPYIAMRYVEGESLARRLERAPGEPLGVAVSVELLEKVARALHAAHAAGIIHRDLKPGNIMVTPSGDPVVLDFGLARELDDDSQTQAWELWGTVAYMAPEQLEPGRPVDARCDVFALGVALFECVTGVRPHAGSTLEELMRSIREQRPPDPRRLERGVSDDLRAVLERAMEKDPSRRYRNAAELADDLRRVRERRPVLARRAGRLRRAWSFARRKPALTAALLLLGVLVAGAGACAAWWRITRADVAAARELERREAVERDLVRGFTRLGGLEPGKALAVFEDVVEREPDSVAAFSGLVLALIDLDRFDEARARLATRADDDVTLPLRAAVLERLGDADGATSCRRRAAERPVTAWRRYVEGQLGLRGIDGADRELSREPSSTALRCFEDACLLSPFARPIFHFARAQAAGMAGDRDAAPRAAEALARLWPDSAPARFFAGFALHGAGFHEQAVEHLERAVALDPALLLARLALAGALLDGGRVDEALAVSRAFLADHPGDPTAQFNVGLACEQLGDLDGAAGGYRGVVEADPEFAGAHDRLATVLEARGHGDDAEEAVRHRHRAAAIRLGERERWAKAHEDDGRAWLELARARLLFDDEAIRLSAVEPARRAVALIGGSDAEALYWLARAHLARDEEDEARACAENARRLAAAGTDVELRRAIRALLADLD